MQKSKPYVNGFCYVLMPKGLHHAETAWEAKELERRGGQKNPQPSIASHVLSEQRHGTSYRNLFVLPVYRFLQVKHLSGEGI